LFVELELGTEPFDMAMDSERYYTAKSAYLMFFEGMVKHPL
jgi:hypothetical protein